MKILLALLLLSSPSLPATLDALPALRQDAPPADSRPEIAAKIEELAAHVKKAGKEDELAIAAIDALTAEFPKSGPKDRAAIVKALDACFKANRSKELEPGVPDDRLYFAAATALGGMAPESVKLLTELLGHKSLRSNLRLQARIAKSLGATKDPKGLDPLMALLGHKDKEMQVAGADALTVFGESDLDTRKRVFEAALNILMDQKAKKDADLNDFEAHDRWNAISGPFVTLLQRLARRNETDPDAWLRWWNKNKKENWDAAKE
jgi:HEAT repeat protein